MEDQNEHEAREHHNRAMLSALIELLIDKDIITQDEFDRKIENFYDAHDDIEDDDENDDVSMN